VDGTVPGPSLEITAADSLPWGVLADGFKPEQWGLTGAAICLLCVAVTLYPTAQLNVAYAGCTGWPVQQSLWTSATWTLRSRRHDAGASLRRLAASTDAVLELDACHSSWGRQVAVSTMVAS
jgi:hypothetical protein